MRKLKILIFEITLTLLIAGCASSGGQYFDLAMSAKNRAPAALAIPQTFEQETANTTTIDPMHIQAEADFLFLKAEMEANAGRNTETVNLLKNALVYDPSSVTMMQRLAVEYYKNSKLPEALEWAEKAYELSSERRDINLLLAGLYTATKNYEKAELIYKKLSKNDADDTDALLYLGAVYTDQKKYPKAIAVFKKLSQHKDYASKHLAHYYRARIFSEQSKFNIVKVKSELRKAIEIKPDFFDAVMMLGHLIESSESQNKAYAFYAEYQKHHGPNMKLAEILAQHYITKNELDKAYEQLDLLEDLTEDVIPVKLKMALILIEKKIYDSAIAKLKEILDLAPDSDKVRFYLSAVYEEKEEYSNAFDQYMKVDKASGYFEEARLHAAYLAKIMGNTDRATVVLKESFDKKAENPQSYFLMAQLFEDKKEFNKALGVLKAAQTKFSKNSQVFYQMGTLQDRLNLKDEMLVSMQKVLSLDPEHAQALNYLAYTWAEKSQHLDLAESYARKAVKNEKEDAYILDTLGWVLFKKGELTEALKVLQHAHNLQPQASIISEHLGDVYLKMNLRDKAQNYFSKAVASEADQERKIKLQTKLAEATESFKNLRLPSSVGPDSDINEAP